MQKFVIQGELCDLNKFIAKNNINRYVANKIKQDMTNICALACDAIQPTDNVFITYKWYCKNKKKDLDNIAFAKKFINDGLIKADKLPNDGWKNITGFKDEFYIDKEIQE